MLDFLSILLSAFIVVFALIQCVVAVWFVTKNRDRGRLENVKEFPKTTVLVGLRGADPFLFDSLKSLLQQDYPNYQVKFVVDRLDDPAWAVVERAISETGFEHASIEEFRDDPRDGIVNSTNSKVVQAARKLDDNVEMIAMMDGDAMPHASWLRELVEPMIKDSKIGATFGNRWFAPSEGGAGSIIRYLWNASAVPPMDFLKMPWGGCYSIRAKAVRDGKLLDVWAKQIALDAGSQEQLKKLGLKMHFVPQLFVVNREECSLGFVTNFIRRQLTWTYLYHQIGWSAIAQPILLAGLILILMLLAVMQIIGAPGNLGSYGSLVALTFYWLSSWACFLCLEWKVRNLIRNRSAPQRWLTFSPRAQNVPAVAAWNWHCGRCCLTGNSMPPGSLAWIGAGNSRTRQYQDCRTGEFRKNSSLRKYTSFMLTNPIRRDW